MIQQAHDFKAESNYLYAILQGVSRSDFRAPTQFKNWTIDTILQHLHYFNIAADLSLMDKGAFLVLLDDLRKASREGKSMIAHTREKLNNLEGPGLLETWHEFSQKMAERFLVEAEAPHVPWCNHKSPCVRQHAPSANAHGLVTPHAAHVRCLDHLK